ncbi:PIN domain-containing protein [Dyadobacter arcticus]|uniref:DUF4935 domain-containing protein n=1 Tax=Dyadobacter arcticus TaxID=1078754 RepID=A0ABX0UQA2_9BACT|nr:PIN domain-containing protein [Dyadobacter arcticus]NIJ55017.1 hypothetical protein [Dyadobacter arcticus]
MHIILDTNIIRQDWRQNSKPFKRLIDYSVKTWSPIVLPEIVMIEIGRLYEREVVKVFSNFRNAFNDLLKLTKNQPVQSLEVPEYGIARIEYEQYLKRRLGQFELIQISPRTDALPDIITRWSENRKPFNLENDAFRDAIIWSSIVDFAKKHAWGPIIFISSNVYDFANSSQDDLHSDLKNEVDMLGLKVKFFKSIVQFNEVYVDHMDFLNEHWLKENIDWDLLNTGVLEGVSGIHCGFYFEYFGRIFTKDFEGNLNYDVVEAAYDGTASTFAADWHGDDEYYVWMNLGGIVVIDYLIDDEVVIRLKAYFHTEVSIEIKGRRIVKYEANYYEENSGLALYVFPD